MIEISNQTPSLGKHISTANIEAVEIIPYNTREYFSVCLYKEPMYKTLRPKSDFKERYLKPFQDDVKRHLEEYNIGLNIFCDEESLELALSLKTGSVYLVKQRPLYPFFQHLYRYYSVFLNQPGVQTYHFRGMDNIVTSDNAMANLRSFHNSTMDILNMPYLRYKTDKYCPIRGSCSVSRRGITSLKEFIKGNRIYPDVQNLTSLWHSDEDFLTEWYNRVKHSLGSFIIVDRKLPMDFFIDLNSMIEKSTNFLIINAERGKI